MAGFWDKEELIREVEINEKNKIMIKKVQKGNSISVDVRKYYTKDGEWLPGKGITIPDSLADEVADAITDSYKIKL